MKSSQQLKWLIPLPLTCVITLHRSSQENGEFAGSFWLCAQCAKALAPLSALLVTPELTGTVSALYEETVARLESSLQTVCADFQPDPYAKVHALDSSAEACIASCMKAADAGRLHPDLRALLPAMSRLLSLLARYCVLLREAALREAARGEKGQKGQWHAGAGGLRLFGKCAFPGRRGHGSLCGSHGRGCSQGDASCYPPKRMILWTASHSVHVPDSSNSWQVVVIVACDFP